MTPNDLQSPPSVEGPPPSGGPPGDDDSKQDISQAHYRTSDEECFQCEHFQDPGTCLLGVNGGHTEPGAGCDLYELKGGDDQGGGDDGSQAPNPAGNGAPPPAPGQ